MANKDDDFNYDREFKARSGVAAFLSNIKDNPDISNDASNKSANGIDTSSLEYLRACCDTGNTGPRNAKKTKLGSMYCEVCDLECTSEIVYEQHIKGSRHAKKLKNQEIMKMAGANVQAASSNDNVKKKVTKNFSLREAILECSDSIIGLHYVEEFLPETNNGDFDPLYECNLCCVNKVSAIPMMDHIVGTKHKTKYLEMRFGLNHLDRDGLIRESRRIEEKEGRNLSVIKTVISNVHYPFSKGKAPVITQANTKAPDAHEVYNRAPVYQHSEPYRAEARPDPELEKAREGAESLAANPVGKLLTSISECSVKNESDAALAYSVSSALVTSLIAYKVKHIKNLESAAQVISSGEGLISSLKMIYDIPTTSINTSNVAPHRAESRYIDEDYSRYRDERTTSHRYDERDAMPRYDDRRDLMPGSYPSRSYRSAERETSSDSRYLSRDYY